MVFFEYVPDDHIRPDLQTTAPVCFRQFFRHGCLRKVFRILFIGVHLPGVIGRYFTDNGPLRDTVLFLCIIILAILEENIGRCSFFSGNDLALHLRDINCKIVVHRGPPISATIALIITHLYVNY